MTEQQKKYTTEAKDALEMLGTGYDIGQRSFIADDMDGDLNDLEYRKRRMQDALYCIGEARITVETSGIRAALREIENAIGAELERIRRHKESYPEKAYRMRVSAGRLIPREGACLICGSCSNLTIDHIIPLSKGGTNELDNLQILCRSCNSKKGAK